jgi:hypothetical protein
MPAVKKTVGGVLKRSDIRILNESFKCGSEAIKKGLKTARELGLRIEEATGSVIPLPSMKDFHKGIMRIREGIVRKVTDKMKFGNPDDELLPVTQCVCGKTFGLWEFVIGIYTENPYGCPSCGRKFYFKQAIEVYEVGEKQ